MDKDDIVDFDDGIVFEKPRSILLVKMDEVLFLGFWIIFQLAPEFVDEAFALGPLTSGLKIIYLFGEHPLLLFSIAVRKKRDELVDGQVVGIAKDNAGDVHFFVVADECVDHPSGRLRLFLQPHQEVKDCLGIRPSIHDIARLDKMRLSCCPVEAIIDNSGPYENFDKMIIVAVEISNGDDFFNACPFALGADGREAGV